MPKIFRQELLNDFHWERVEIAASSFGPLAAKRLDLRRDDQDRLVLEVISTGALRSEPDDVRAGTVRQPSEVIEFVGMGGERGVASGVSHVETSTRAYRDEPTETTNVYLPHKVAWTFDPATPAAYVVDWVSDVPAEMIWPALDKVSIVETYEAKVGPADVALAIAVTAATRHHGSRAIHFNVEGYDVFVRREDEASDEMIVYRPPAPPAMRTKIRDALAFVLGRPISYYGCSWYDADWTPLRTEAVSGPVFRRYAKGDHALPPYPLNVDPQSYVIDGATLERTVRAIVANADALRFGEVIWAYWFAIYAPLHIASVHFGALIERLMRTAQTTFDIGAPMLLNPVQTRELQHQIGAWLDDAKITADIARLVKGKASSLAQPPPTQRLATILQAMGLEATALEIASWRNRNRAAHGVGGDDPPELILGARVQRILVARIIAALTHCSDRYVDYYSFDHPVRPLAQGVPPRPDDAPGASG